MTNYPLHDLENSSISIFKRNSSYSEPRETEYYDERERERAMWNRERERRMNGIEREEEHEERNMSDEIINEVVKLKSELKNAALENIELKRKYEEDTSRLNALAAKNANILDEIANEKKLIQMEYENFKEESTETIRRLQTELDKNIIFSNRLKDEIFYKEEDLKRAQVLEKLYKEEIAKNEEKDRTIYNLEILLNEKEKKGNEKETEKEKSKEQKQRTEELEKLKKELSYKKNDLGNLHKKYEMLKKNNREIENKIHALQEEADYYKNNENIFLLHKVCCEENVDDSIVRRHMVKVCVLYNLVYRMLVCDQRCLMEREKMLYALEKENAHFLKKFITDEIYAHYLKDCISKINLTYQIDLHKQEKKFILLNSEYDELYNKFLLERNENCILNEEYDKIIYQQKEEIHHLKSVVSEQNRDKEILTRYIDNYITYIEKSYEKFCTLKNDYNNLEELVQDLEEKNRNLTKLMNEMNAGKRESVCGDNQLTTDDLGKTDALSNIQLEQVKIMRNELKDKDIRIIELENKNADLRKQIECLKEQVGDTTSGKEQTENEALKMKELCFNLEEMYSKLELEAVEKDFQIKELTNALKKAETKNDDNKVMQELSDFRIQNFNENLKYYQQKITELNEQLKEKETEMCVMQEYNKILKEEKEKCMSEVKNMNSALECLQAENNVLKNEKMLIRKNILDTSNTMEMDSFNKKKAPAEDANQENVKHATEEQEQLYRDVMKLKQSKKKILQENHDMEIKMRKLEKENNLIIEENEKLYIELQTLSKENVKIKNDILCAEADAKKSLFCAECEKKEKIKYKLLLQQARKKSKKIKTSHSKMVKMIKYFVDALKKIDKENKRIDINNSLFVSSSSASSNNMEECGRAILDENNDDEYISVNGIDNTQLVLSSVSKSRNSGNNVSTNGRRSVQSRSTKVNKDFQHKVPFSIFTKNEKNNRLQRSTRRKASKKKYMTIKMHRFTVCNNFRINIRKYKKAYKKLNNRLNYLNERRNDDLNIFTTQHRGMKTSTVDTFYSIPNSAESRDANDAYLRGGSKDIEGERKGRKRKAAETMMHRGEDLAEITKEEQNIINRRHRKEDGKWRKEEESFFEADKLINDVNYIIKKYESKAKENVTIQRRLMNSEKELHSVNIRYEELVHEHDSLINDIKERTDKLASIEASYNVLFAKYNETQDEIKMHEQKTQDIFKECNELVEYMKTKEKKIKEFDDHLNKMEMKYKEEKEKNDILTKDNVTLNNLNLKYKEDIELYRKRYESIHEEMLMKISKIEEMEQNEKNIENEIYYLKAATYKYEVTLKESHDELNKTNELILQLKKEISEKTKLSEKMKEQILKRDYLIYNVGRSYKSKEYFYKNLKLKVHGFNKTFIELCESFELSEVKKINDLYKEFEYTDEDYRTHISNMLLNQGSNYMESFEDILKKVDVVADMNIQYEKEKQEMINVIKELENKLRKQMSEHNMIYEEYEKNINKILFEKEEQMNDCVILSEDLKKKTTEIHVLMKEVNEKNIELNEINMKCTFLSEALQNLENERNHLNEKLRDVEDSQEKKLSILNRENEGLKEDVRHLKNIVNSFEEEMRRAHERVEFLNREKIECEKEIERLKDFMEEEKKYNELFKENEQNYIQEIKEAHVYAIKKEEEIATLKVQYENEQQQCAEEIQKLKVKNEEMNNVIKNHLKTLSDLETQMVEYKVLLDSNTSMKMQMQDLETKLHELVKDNEKLCVDLKKEKILSEEKDKDIETLNKTVKIFERNVYEENIKTLKMKDEIEQLTQEIGALQDIKKTKDDMIEQLESNLRKAVFGNMQINEMEKERIKQKHINKEENAYAINGINTELNNGALMNNEDLVNSQMCIFNNTNNIGSFPTGYRNRRNEMEWNSSHIQELRKYSLVLKEENDLMKQELRKLKDKTVVGDRKHNEMEKIVEKRDFIIKKMNEEILEYQEKMKNLEKNMDKLNSELCASNELLALRNDECKELTNELYELTDAKNKLLVKTEVFQKQMELYKIELTEKEEQLKEKNQKDINVEMVEKTAFKRGTSEHDKLIKELNEKDSVISEYTRNLNFYYKIFCHIMYFKKCIEKEVNTTKNYMDGSGLIHTSISVSFLGSESVGQELDNIKVTDINKISDYINEFLKCVRLLIFKKRVFESKLESVEKKYNEFKEKLEEEKEVVTSLKKKIRQYEEVTLEIPSEDVGKKNDILFSSGKFLDPAVAKENEKENKQDGILNSSYKMHSENIRRKNEKSALLEKEKNEMFLKFENERLAEENKYLNGQIHSLLVFKNNIKEMKEHSERELQEELYRDNGKNIEYTMLMKNKCLKLQIETVNNELNIYKNKNEYLKKTVISYEEIIATMQKELMKIIETQRKCDEEFYKVESELEQKKREMEYLQRKRKEDAENIEAEYSKNVKIEKEYIALKDENFKKETKMKELEEVIKKLKEDIEEQLQEKEELQEFSNCMKIKYTTAEEKYNELLNVLEKEKEDFSENKRDEISNLVKKLKKYDEIITDLLDEKTTLLHKYEELKKVYAEKTKAESVLLQEVSLLEKNNVELKEKARELNDRIKLLMEENEQYNMKLFNLDKEKLDLYMKYLKVSEELNNMSSHGNIKENEKKKESKNKSVVEADPLMNSLWVMENEIDERERKLEQKLQDINKNVKKDSTIVIQEEQKEKNAFLEKAKHEIDDLTTENDLLKTKIVELEKLNRNIFDDNKELIRIISSIEKEEKKCANEKYTLDKKIGTSVGEHDMNEPNALENLSFYNSVSKSTYQNLLNEHHMMKQTNGNLLLEMENMRSQLNEYKNMINKQVKIEECNKKARNYLRYLNDKIKKFIEIFNEKNFNYEFFKKELKKMKSTNLMMLEDNLEIDKDSSSFFKKEREEDKRSSSNLEESIALSDLKAEKEEEETENDSVSIDTRIIVNFFSAYDNEKYKKEIIIGRKELNQFYKYILQLKEHHKKKSLLIENQKGQIRALNEEVMTYAENHKEMERQWQKKINELLNEHSLHTEKFTKIHDTLIKTLEEEMEKNKKLVKEIDQKNEQLKRKEEKELRMENLLQLKDADMYSEFADEDLKNMLLVKNKYNEVKEHNTHISKLNEELLEENNTIKEAVINMKKEIDQLTEEINEKKILLNKRNVEIEELRRKVASGSHRKSKDGNNNNNNIISVHEEKEKIPYSESESNLVKSYEHVILLMEQRNNELEEQCEQLKKMNQHMGHKYNNALNAYNQINETVKRNDIMEKENLDEIDKKEELEGKLIIPEKQEYEQQLAEVKRNLVQKEVEYTKLKNNYTVLLNEYEKCVQQLEKEKKEREKTEIHYKNEKDKTGSVERSMQQVLNERERVLEDMQRKITKLETEIKELNNNLSEEMQSKENMKKENSTMCDMLNKEIEFLKNQKLSNSTYIKELGFEISNLKNEISMVNNILKDSKEQEHMLKEKLREKENTITKMKSKIEENRRTLERISPNVYGSDLSPQREDVHMINSSKTSQWEFLLQQERERLEEYEKEVDQLKRKNEQETEDYFQKLKELRMEVKKSNDDYNKLKYEMEKKIEAYVEEIKELQIYKKRIEKENLVKTEKDKIIEVAIKEMDHEIDILKTEADQRNAYVKELEEHIRVSNEQIQWVEGDVRMIENFVQNAMYTEKEVNVKEINQKVNEVATKIEELYKTSEKKKSTVHVSLLQSICRILQLNIMVLNELKHKEEELKNQIHSKEKELLELDDTLNKMVADLNKRQQNIEEKRKELYDLTNELVKKKEEESRIHTVLNETQSKENSILLQKEKELMHNEQELKKAREEIKNFGDELKKKKEELNLEKKEFEKDKAQLEKQKEEIGKEFDKLYTAHKEIKMKETKLKKIYEKIKDQNLIELLDISNNGNEGCNENDMFLDKELSILNSSLSFKKISENEIDEKINLDSIEYTTYFKEFKKRIKNLKADLQNKEKDLEIYKKTLEIEKKEKEIYRMEFEKMEEVLNTEKKHVEKLEEELSKYKSDDTNVMKRLKESEQLLEERNAEIVELQQKLLECSYEMSLLDSKKKVVENENVELVKEVERLNQIIKKSERNIKELNKEKLHITQKSIEKIIYDGEDIKQLKDNLEEAHERINSLQNKNEELDKINVELKEANKEMRYDIDVLLLNLENITEEKALNENKLKENEKKYNELKTIYEEKEKEYRKIFHMLSEKKKKKVTQKWEKRQATLTSLNDTSTGLPYGTQDDTQGNLMQNGSIKNGSVKEKGEYDEDIKFHKISAVSFSEDPDINEEEKAYRQELNEKNIIIESLNEKITQYSAANAKQEQVIEEYKSMLDKFSSKINMFGDNLDLLGELNQFLKDNNFVSEDVMNLIKTGYVYQKIVNKILFETQFFKLILFLRECIEKIASKGRGFSKKTSEKGSFTKIGSSPLMEVIEKTKEQLEKEGEEEEDIEEDYNYFYSNEMDTSYFFKLRHEVKEIEKVIHSEMVYLKEHFTTFENLCDFLCSCYRNNDINIVYEKLNELEYSFKSIIDGSINQLNRVRDKVHFEKEGLRENVRLLKEQMANLTADFMRNVEETKQQNIILTNEQEEIKMLVAENTKLKDLYEKLNEDYNEKLLLLQNNEYELNELKEELLEKSETKEKTEEINEYLKNDLNYLNTSLDKATQSLTELKNENTKNKMVIHQMEKENEYLKTELQKKKILMEEIERKLEASDSMVEELKEINGMLMNQLEEELEKGKCKKKSSLEQRISSNNEIQKRKSEENEKEGTTKREGEGEGEGEGERNNYNKEIEKELREIIRDLKSDNRILSEELETVNNNFTVLQEKKRELEEIISTNDITLNKKEIELNDYIIEKEKYLEEINRYHVKCVQMVTICFNDTLKIYEIRERIINIWEVKEDHYLKYNKETEEEILHILKNYKNQEKREEFQNEQTPISEEKQIVHIEEMSKKNEELIKKNEEIWKLNKYIEELNKAITNRDYTLLKNQQIIENQKDILEDNKKHIKFLKDQIKLLCDNIDADTMFNINNVNLTPELRNIIKRKSFLNERSEPNSRASIEKRDNKNGSPSTDQFKNREKRRVSANSNEAELNFYDEKEVEIEEMKLKIDQATDDLKSAEILLKKLREENKELTEQCEYLKKELQSVQGTKRNLMLCESRIEILENELEEKTKQLKEQSQTVNDCVNVYVEENSENFQKILELKKENEKYKIEIKIMNDEIRQLKNDIHNYKNEIKEVNATLEQYQTTHEQLINQFNKGETNNLYYMKLCEILKKENQDYKKYVKIEEDKKQMMLNDINNIKLQLYNSITQQNEITLDLEFFQEQNNILKRSCAYYKERETLFIHLLKEPDSGSTMQLIENCDEDTLKNFVQNLNKQINELNHDVEVKSKTITSLKYQLKEYHLLETSKNDVNTNVDAYDKNQLVDINNLTYIRNNLFIYINLFKSVMCIIKEILFYADPENNLYVEILKIMQIQDAETEPEMDSMIKNFKFAKIDADINFQTLLKSKPVLREKLKMLQLKVH